MPSQEKDVDRLCSVPAETMPSLGLECHLNDIREVVQLLNERGIATKSTRIERYAQFLKEVCERGSAEVDVSKIFKTSAGTPFSSPGDWFLYVLREVHEVMWILKGLKSTMPPGVEPKLRTVVGGRDFAALDGDSRSRDAQFELRIASYFCQAGCDVDLSTNTDVVATTTDHCFYVECKRVSSTSQFGKRLSEARFQLAQRMPRKDGRRLVLGCVAVDVTKVAFAHNGLTWGISNAHSRDVIQRKLIGIAESEKRALSFDSCRKLLCYWLQIHIASLTMQPIPQPGTRLSSYHIPRPGLGRKEAKAVAAFWEIYESVSTEDRRSSQSRKIVRRESVAFPRGTLFGIDEERILALLAQRDVGVKEQSEVVARLKIADQEHEFTFLEFAMLPMGAREEWRSARAAGAPRADIALLARLFAQRFPEEGSESLPLVGA